MLLIDIAPADLRHPLASRIQEKWVEPAAPCEGLHCQRLPALAEDPSTYALAETVEKTAVERGIDVLEASDLVIAKLPEHQYATQPGAFFHGHLVVVGREPDAAPRWYVLEPGRDLWAKASDRPLRRTAWTRHGPRRV